MKLNFTRQLMAALILTLLLTGFSCAKKEIASQPDMTTGSTSETATETSDRDLQAEKEEAIRAEALRDRLAREREAEQARLADAMNQFANQHILFEFDSAELDDTAKALVREKAEWLRDNQAALITIEGHCDLRGTTSYNLALGERRALAVKNYLENLGIPRARLGWVSFGEEQPLVKEETSDAHRLNRRAQFRVQNQVAHTQN
jgi:peptidoglycan-associated lipoprotein